MFIKKRLIGIMFLCFCIFFSGCEFNSSTQTVNILNPFMESSESLMSEYGHSLFSFPDDDTFYYQGGLLEVPYIFYGGRVDSEVGLLVFIDGIVQPYFINNTTSESEFKYMYINNIAANSEQVVTLSILPTVGKMGDELQLNFVCIDFPSLTDKSMLNLQSMSTTFSWKLSFLSDISTDPVSLPEIGIRILETSDTIDIDFEVYGNFYLETDNESKVARLFASEEENEGIHRITMFINNNPAIIDGYRNYFDIDKSDVDKKIYKFQVEEDNLSDLGILYAIGVSLNDYVRDNQIDVVKTNSQALEIKVR